MVERILSPDDLIAVEQSLARYRRNFILLNLLDVLPTAIIILFGLLSLFQLCFAIFPWTILPLAWDAAIAVFILFTMGFIADKGFIHAPSLHYIAGIMEKRFRLSPRWLSLALELQFPDVLGSEQLKTDALKMARHCLQQCPEKFPIRFSPFIRSALPITILLWIGLTAFIRPGCAAFWDLPFTLGGRVSARIVPGGVTLPLHASVKLRCIPRTNRYPSCRIAVRDLETGAGRSIFVRPDSSGEFSLSRDGLTRSFAYQFTLGMTAFPPETVRVAQPPTLFSMRIRIIPPAYVGLPPALLQEGRGSFSAFAGSVAHYSISSPSALARARFCPSAGDTVPFVVKGNEATGEAPVRRSCSYTFSLVDTFGQKSDSLSPFYIDLTPDQPPFVHFLKPGMNKELTPALAETLWIEAFDDIGIKQCAFHWRKNTESSDTSHSRSLLSGDAVQTSLRRELAWDVRELSLYPGDTVFYWASVRDNDPFDTSHTGVSETFWLRLPSFEEINKRLVEGQNTTDQSLQSAQARQDKLRNTLEDLLKSTRGKESLTWEQKRILSDLKESVKAQSDTLANAIESLKRTVDQLKQQGLAGQDLIDKMDKVKKALEEIARDYGDSLLFEPPRKNESLGLDDLKNALEKFKKMLPDLAQQLDNALKYLEMLKRDQRLADLALRAEKYGKEQVDLASARPQNPLGLQREKEVTKKIEELLSDISKKTDGAALSKEDLPSLQQTQSRLEAMQNELSKNSLPQEEDMDQMSAALFALAQNLRDQQSSAMMVKLKKEKESLLEMSHDALSMASWQKETAMDAAGESSRMRGKSAKAQQALKQALLTSAEKLNALSMTTPQTLRQLMKQYNDAAESMDRSLDALKNEMDAAGEMESGEQRLNGLANSLIDVAGSLDGGQEGQGGGMGQMMGGFQRLSGKQAMINSATGNILRQMLSGRGMPGQDLRPGDGQGSAAGEKARQEAQARQKEIADALDKLAETYGKQAGSGMEKKAKDLEEEARKLAKMLENPKPEIQEHQQRFLSRMLQTTLSMHKQDEGKDERQSQSAKNVFPSTIQNSGNTEFNDRDSFFRIRQKAFSGNFPENYRGAIKNYFDSLGTVFLKDK
jgi:hypothetical protein